MKKYTEQTKLSVVEEYCSGSAGHREVAHRHGVDASSAKAIRMGADLVGQAAGGLRDATLSTAAVIEHFDIVIRQLRIACFCTGSADLKALRTARLLAPLCQSDVQR